VAWFVEQWPQADQAAWARARTPGGLLDDDGDAAEWRPATIKSALGAYGRFLAYLERIGLTQTQFCERHQLDRIAVQRAVNGDRKRISVDFACAMEDATGGEIPVRLWRKPEGSSRRRKGRSSQSGAGALAPWRGAPPEASLEASGTRVFSGVIFVRRFIMYLNSEAGARTAEMTAQGERDPMLAWITERLREEDNAAANDSYPPPSGPAVTRVEGWR